jgi:hypothetical protein
VVDHDNGLVIATVPRDSRAFDEPFISPLTAFPTEAGVMGAVYAVLPPLADGVTTVDVQVGFGATVPDVPVGEGLLGPVVEGRGAGPARHRLARTRPGGPGRPR